MASDGATLARALQRHLRRHALGHAALWAGMVPIAGLAAVGRAAAHGERERVDFRLQFDPSKISPVTAARRGVIISALARGPATAHRHHAPRHDRPRRSDASRRCWEAKDFDRCRIGQGRVMRLRRRDVAGTRGSDIHLRFLL
jgi:hypothetical protein